MPAPSLITDLSQVAASNSPSGSESPSVLDDVQRAHASFIAMLRDGKGATVAVTLASAATTDVGNQNSMFVNITGTTTITSLGTNYNGPRICRLNGTLILTHSANLLLPGGANITTTSGDWFVAVPNPSGTGWVVVSYHRGGGVPGVSVRDFGAIGNGVADDTAAVQACVTYCLANNKAVYFPSGYYKLTSTVTVNASWSFYGDGITSIVYVTDPTIPAFTFNINGTSVSGWRMTDFQVQGPLTTNVASTAFRFIGDATAYVQHGYCNVFVYGFGSAVKDEKTPRTTPLGTASMLNWNTWDWKILNTGVAAYWGTQGSGTGNQWFGSVVMNGAGARTLLFEGSGCEVGDIIVAGHWGNQVAGGVGVEIGASTVYRAQIALGAVQFDANCDIPIKLSSTGAVSYTNISLQGNNLGGSAALGASLQPLRRSVIQDRDVSYWQAGHFLSTTVVVLTTTSVFDIDFASWGSGNFRIVASGLVGGVGSGLAVAEYDIRESSGSLTVTSIANRLAGPAACAAITVTAAGTKATVKLTYTPASAGTEVITTITGSGDKFKITRL